MEQARGNKTRKGGDWEMTIPIDDYNIEEIKAFRCPICRNVYDSGLGAILCRNLCYRKNKYGCQEHEIKAFDFKEADDE